MFIINEQSIIMNGMKGTQDKIEVVIYSMILIGIIVVERFL